MKSNSSFERLGAWSVASVDKLVAAGDLRDLVLIPIAITCWGTPDAEWSEATCLLLARHSEPNVRGNAVLGLGHLARVAGALALPESIDVVRSGLSDPDEYVRGQAHAAADDFSQFLGVDLA